MSASESNRVQISMPEGGFRSHASEQTRSLSLLGDVQGSNPTNGMVFSAPASLSDFKCVAVIVTGEGIFNDPRMDTQCDPRLDGARVNTGIIAGLVPSSGGVIDLQIPSGPGRLIRLLGLQGTAAGGCPSIDSLLSDRTQVPGGSGGGQDLGDPFEIARITQDIFADQSIVMTARFVPGSKPAFACRKDEQKTTSAQLAISELDLFPHTPSSASQIRIVGTFSGSPSDILVYSDATCTTQLSPVGGWSGADNKFMRSVSVPQTSVPDVYVKAIGSSAATTTPCMRVPGAGFQYVSAGTRVEINTPSVGTFWDSTTTLVQFGGLCGPAAPPSQVEIFINDSASSIVSATCSSTSFSSATVSISSIPDGLVKIKAVSSQSGANPSDDALYVIKDSQAPSMTLTTPSSNELVPLAGISSLTVSGTCGASSSPVTIGYYLSPGQSPTHLADTTCSASVYTATVNLTGAPDGTVYIHARHWGSAGEAHSTRKTITVIKNSAVVDMYGVNPSIPFVAKAMAEDASGNLYVVGSGAVTGANRHWLVRKLSGGIWTTVDDFQLLATYDSEANAVVINSTTNTVYVAGYGINGTGSHWIVRSSVGGTSGSFTDMSTWQSSTGANAEARAMAIDSTGNLFVAGCSKATSAGGQPTRLQVRTWNGSSWILVAPFSITTEDACANAIAIGSNGATVHVAGFATTAGQQRWIIGASTDGGNTFNYETPLDAIAGSTAQEAKAIAIDGSGLIYVAGSARDLSSEIHWQVRTYNGTNWVTLDDLLPTAVGGIREGHAQALVITGTEVFVGGRFYDPPANGSSYVLRKWNGSAWTQTQIANATGSEGIRALLRRADGSLYSCGAMLKPGTAETNWIVKSEPAF